MICEVCHGSGVYWNALLSERRPCPDCIGGVASCCDAAGSAVPGYWMHETSGVLRPAILAYLKGAEMTGEECAAMRAYLRQWIAASWVGDPPSKLTFLRAKVDSLMSRAAIDDWLDQAADIGIDPL
jgi:hypothetical protein